jgi:alpha-tubulin suppressor-like RCC1 family protein
VALAVIAAALLTSCPAASIAAGSNASIGQIAASDHTCAITAGGGARCWGDNSAGGLGDGTRTASGTPVAVAGLEGGVQAIAAGDRYSCALTASGGVKCWGYNEFGQLGDGSTTDRPRPVDVVGLASGVSAIAARGEHTCALNGGRVKCWGANVNGQLGDGTTTNRPTPVDVVGISSRVVAIATGGEHTCAITDGSGVKCWGWNGTGQLGIGSTTDSSHPTDVVGLGSDVSAIATGGRHTCALMAAGVVKCWGYDEFGQLGDGTTTDSPIPVDVAVLTGSASAIATGGNLTCALKPDSVVTCWGLDVTGQLPDGATFGRKTSVDVAGLPPVTSVVAGFYHVCAITRDGGVVCWGGNDTGQLGNGTTSDTATPVEVRNADGSALVVAGADASQASGLPPMAMAAVAAVAGVVGVVLIFALARRAVRRSAPRP